MTCQGCPGHRAGAASALGEAWLTAVGLLWRLLCHEQTVGISGAKIEIDTAKTRFFWGKLFVWGSGVEFVGFHRHKFVFFDVFPQIAGKL